MSMLSEIVVNNLNYIVKLQRSLSALNGKGNEAFTINLNHHLCAAESGFTPRLQSDPAGNDALL